MWFEVDKAGLRKLLEQRGKAFAVFELISNAWDTKAKKVDVHLRTVPGRAQSTIHVIDDDPDGFKNLTHAWTLFAESDKKASAEQRGRFNLGEKLVLALCDEASIRTTTGEVVFDEDGRRTRRLRTEAGSRFEGLMRMTREEHNEALAALRRLIPPPTCATEINGELLPARTPIATFAATLTTEIADPEGNLRRTARKTVVNVYESNNGETPSLYEMGIPVVETNDRWHYEVMQKVPLNFDRDNVPPGYLRQLRTLVADHTRALLTQADAVAPWGRDAASDPNVDDATVTRLLDLRYGPKRVIYDPSDAEANKLAVSQGYTVIHGSTLSKSEWENVRRAGAARPAGQVTPSPKPYGDGPSLKLLPSEKWTDSIQRTVAHAKRLARELLDRSIVVQVAHDMGLPAAATYGPDGVLTLNLARLGHAWFDDVASNAQHRLLIHEFGHNTDAGCDHLSSAYHDALCRLGAKLAQLALRQPDLFFRAQTRG